MVRKLFNQSLCKIAQSNLRKNSLAHCSIVLLIRLPHFCCFNKMANYKSLIICIILTLIINTECTDLQILEFGIENREDNFFTVQPNHAKLNASDFTFCLRCKFWSFGNRIVLSTNTSLFAIDAHTYGTALYRVSSNSFRFTIDALKVSPVLWNSFCFVYNSTSSNLTITLNSKVVAVRNITRPTIDLLTETVTIGGAQKKYRFSGQVTDYNLWSKALDQEEVNDLTSGCADGLLQR